MSLREESFCLIATLLICVCIPYNIKLYTPLHDAFTDYGVPPRAGGPLARVVAGSEDPAARPGARARSAPTAQNVDKFGLIFTISQFMQCFE